MQVQTPAAPPGLSLNRTVYEAATTSWRTSWKAKACQYRDGLGLVGVHDTPGRSAATRLKSLRNTADLILSDKGDAGQGQQLEQGGSRQDAWQS